MTAVLHPYRWQAGPDREAHAIPARGRVTTTACDRPATDDRLAWPERSRCPRCLATLGLLPLGGDAA